MASIHHAGIGRWKAVVRRTGYPSQSKTFRTKRDAEDWARSVEDQRRRGLFMPRSGAEKTTLDVALSRYLEQVSARKAQSTHISEIKKSRPLLAALGKYSLAAITPEVVAGYRDMRRKTVSDDTVRLELALLSHLFSTAVREWGLGLVGNPARSIAHPPPSPGRNRRLSEDEEARLLDACDRYRNPMLGWIVRLGLHTAMRSGEILSLTVSSVDLANRCVRLDRTKSGERRTVPLSAAALRVLRAALAHPRPADTDLIFYGRARESGQRRPYEYRKAWNDLKKALGMADFRFHDLRHEATSRLVVTDRPIKATDDRRNGATCRWLKTGLERVSV
jgi:integrase